MGEAIVFGSIAFALLFTGAWLFSRDVRAWLERPKHRFLQNVERYDRSRSRRHQPDGRSSP